MQILGELWANFDPIFGKGQQLWESYCGQGVTWITQVPNVIIGHVQDIVLGFESGQKLHLRPEKSKFLHLVPTFNSCSLAPNG